MIDTNSIEELVEILYPYFLKRLESEGILKNCMRMKNATVKSIPTEATNVNKYVDVVLPYDTNSISALNNTGEELSVGDMVCVMYWVDLKNAVVMFKTT